MAWSCRRPGCHRPAGVSINYDPVGRQVWLDPLVPGAPRAQMLCAEHAERLSPPRGWVVLDRRGAQTVLVTPAAALAPNSPRTPRRQARRWGELRDPAVEPTLEFTAGRSEPPAVEPLVAEPAVPEHVDSDPAEPVRSEPRLGTEARREETESELATGPAEVADPPGTALGDTAPPEDQPAPPEDAAPPEDQPADQPAPPEEYPAPAEERVDDLEPLFAPTGRLLSRAFTVASGPQSSVLGDLSEDRG